MNTSEPEWVRRLAEQGIGFRPARKGYVFRPVKNRPSERPHDYGRSFLWGHLLWRYDLTAGAGYVSDHGQELRWYGLRVPFTQIAIGFLIRRIP